VYEIQFRLARFSVESRNCDKLVASSNYNMLPECDRHTDHTIVMSVALADTVGSAA